MFIPILLMGGIVGRLFASSRSVISNHPHLIAVSLTTTPMMCARLLRRR
jgi:multidrug efflux pump